MCGRINGVLNLSGRFRVCGLILGLWKKMFGLQRDIIYTIYTYAYALSSKLLMGDESVEKEFLSVFCFPGVLFNILRIR